jgi:hypothetical protein
MRSTDFIRQLLDLLDNVEAKQPTNDCEVEKSEEENPEQGFSNAPDETYTSTKMIMSVGNDINKPKHPSDLRADSVSLYPNMQYKGDNQ